MKTIKKLIFLIFITIVLVFSYYFYMGYNLYKNAIAETPLETKIKEIKNNEYYTNIDDINPYFLKAVISIEDHRFYQHKGFDKISTTKAIITNIMNKKIIAGGSSITQQLAKNMYFYQEKKFERKFAEMFIVSKLEENLSKGEILELYLNIIYYGNGYYGINEASKGYFNKDPKDLTEDEATLLAGIVNAPSAYSLSKHENLARERQKQVIKAMEKYKIKEEIK